MIYIHVVNFINICLADNLNYIIIYIKCIKVIYIYINQFLLIFMIF